MRKEYDFEGKVYKDFTELCITHNISVETVHYRLSAGWGLTEAVKTPVSMDKIPKSVSCKDHKVDTPHA